MLSKKLESALNQQVKIEGDSSQIYLSMASWAENEGFEGISTFMYAQSDEERMHMLKLIKYINQRGGEAVIPEIIKPSLDHTSFKTLFTQLFEHEVLFQKASTNWFTLLWKKRIMPHIISCNGMYLNRLKKK